MKRTRCVNEDDEKNVQRTRYTKILMIFIQYIDKHEWWWCLFSADLSIKGNKTGKVKETQEFCYCSILSLVCFDSYSIYMKVQFAKHIKWGWSRKKMKHIKQHIVQNFMTFLIVDITLGGGNYQGIALDIQMSSFVHFCTERVN